MIDIEGEVYDGCVRAVKRKCPGIFHTNMGGLFPSAFPAVKVVEISNVEASQLHDSSNRENGALLVYQIDSYADARKSGARKLAKEISGAADSAMREMGFERTFGQLVEEQSGKASAVRYITRYTGIAGNAHKSWEDQQGAFPDQKDNTYASIGARREHIYRRF